MADDAGQTKVRFDPPTKAELRRISFERDIPVAELVREAVADWLHGQNEKPMSPAMAAAFAGHGPAASAAAGRSIDPIREPFEETP